MNLEGAITDPVTYFPWTGTYEWAGYASADTYLESGTQCIGDYDRVYRMPNDGDATTYLSKPGYGDASTARNFRLSGLWDMTANNGAGGCVPYYPALLAANANCTSNVQMFDGVTCRNCPTGQDYHYPNSNYGTCADPVRCTAFLPTNRPNGVYRGNTSTPGTSANMYGMPAEFACGKVFSSGTSHHKLKVDIGAAAAALGGNLTFSTCGSSFDTGESSPSTCIVIDTVSSI